MVLNGFNGILMDLPLIHTKGKMRASTAMIGLR